MVVARNAGQGGEHETRVWRVDEQSGEGVEESEREAASSKQAGRQARAT